MSSKKVLKQDRRGGRRENAGRKAIWKNKDTMTIRVPKLIATQVLELAHKLDSGEKFDLDTESKIAKNDAIATEASCTQLIVPSKSLDFEIITKTKLPERETEHDFVINSNLEEENERITESITTSNLLKNEIITNSNLTEYEAIKIAKKILKHKKSARISLAKLISKLYSRIVSPEDLK